MSAVWDVKNILQIMYCPNHVGGFRGAYTAALTGISDE